MAMKTFKINFKIQNFIKLKFCVITICVATSFCLFSAGKSSDRFQYVNPTPGEMPILAWEPFAANSNPNVERYQIMKDAGFNATVCFISDTILLSKSMQCAGEAGVKMIITCPQLKKIDNLPGLVKKYSNFSNLAGFYLWDEPYEAQFEEIKNFQKAIYTIDSKCLPLVTLFPQIGRFAKAADYRSYVKSFITSTMSPLVCYDNYPIVKQDGKIFVRDNFYENLEIVSSLAKEYKIPFWAFCMSTQHGLYPSATVAYLTFEAFSALAYGAQGINYYTYGTKTWETNQYAYTDAPIGPNGKKTKIWYYAQTVNKQIQNLSSVFLNCQVVKTGHIGQSIPTGTKHFSEFPDPFSSLNAERAGVLISHITNQGKNYLVVVNHDVLKKQQINYKLNSPVERIDNSGKWKTVKSGSYSLPAGGYIIFKW